MASLTTDVCIVGGGPAGAVLAMRLAQLGRRVAIVEKAGFPRPHVGESLTAAVGPLLESAGLGGVVEAAGGIASPFATVDWAGRPRRYRVQGSPGRQVDRGRFDAELLGCASRAPGVTLFQPAHPVAHVWADHQWTIRLDTGDVIYARYLADAAGRSRLLPGAKQPIGAPTLAVFAYWTDTEAGQAGDTLIEGGASEWFWGAPVPGGTFNATVFVDAGPVADYQWLLARSRLLRPRLAGATLRSPIRVCDATPYLDVVPVTHHSIKVGDAALSIDPLSSQGVQTAIGTALHAAVVVNTMIERPEDSELAIGFYRSRVEHSATYHRDASGRLYEEHAAAGGGLFWRRRAHAPRPAAPRGALTPAAIVQVPRRVGFGTVAIAGATHVVGHDGVTVEGRDYAFVANGLSIAPLLREIDAPMPAMEVVRRWSRTMTAAEALQVLTWAWAEGLVDSPVASWTAVERPATAVATGA